MSRTKAKHLPAAWAVTVAALATPVAAAGSAAAESRQVAPLTTATRAAAADPGDGYWCVKKLSDKGYQVGPKSIKACGDAGDPTDGNGRNTCMKLLQKAGVKYRDSDYACTRIHG